MGLMSVKEILNQITAHNGKVTSKSSGIEYDVKDFIEQISEKCKLSKKERKELESHFIDYVQPQSDKSQYIEQIIEKYNFKFSNGIYIIKDKIMTLDEVYRFMWKEERLLPTETEYVIENVEKISEPLDLQNGMFEYIQSYEIKGESKYLKSLDKLYPEIDFRAIIHNILYPNTKPLFHIFYDDGVGGTGKSTLLEVLTMIVGENRVSNVLLDQFGNRFVFANMMGKYLNIGDDNGKNDELQNVGTLKSIVTGGRVTIDRKNISPIEVRIFAKQLFATNILPYIDFTDGGVMRRLNIVKMNKVVPNTMKLCKLDDEEIGHIIYECLRHHDIERPDNTLAITSHPLYRFYTEKGNNKDYFYYKSFCQENGFRQMNITNFEVKSKFIKHFIENQESDDEYIEIDEDLPF